MKYSTPIDYNSLAKEEQIIEIPFSDAVYNAIGVVYPVPPEPDGHIHRFGRKNCCWYWLYQNSRTGAIYGSFGDWTKGDKGFKYHSQKSGWTDEDTRRFDALQEQRKREQEEMQRVIQKEMREEFSLLRSASDAHPYLVKKGVRAMPDMKLGEDEELIIPLRDKDGNLWTLQRIYPDGQKRFLGGVSTSGVRYTIPGDERIFLCEGVATGLSISAATGATVVCAMNAGNLPKIAKDYKGAVIVADNDESKAGEEAAKKCEGYDYILPPDVGMDANDYAQKYGNEKLRELLLPGEKKPYSVPLISKVKQPTFSPYLIKDWFCAGQIGMCFGASGSGKTFFLLDQMLTLSSGLLSWHGKKCKKCNVYYLCGEGFEGIPKRVKAWMLFYGVEDIGNINITENSVDLSKPGDLQYVLDDMEKCAALWESIDLVVIDTYNQFNGGDENAADAVHAFLENIKKMGKMFGSAILLSHHVGVGQDAQKRSRGSSAMKAAMDFEFLVEKGDGDDTFTVQQTKQKDFELQKPMGFRLHQVNVGWKNEDGDEINSAVAVAQDNVVQPAKLSTSFDIYSLFMCEYGRKKSYDVKNGFWCVPKCDMEEFAINWKRAWEGKEIAVETARVSLYPDKSIGKLFGEKLKKGEGGFWLVKAKCNGVSGV